MLAMTSRPGQTRISYNELKERCDTTGENACRRKTAVLALPQWLKTPIYMIFDYPQPKEIVDNLFLGSIIIIYIII